MSLSINDVWPLLLPESESGRHLNPPPQAEEVLHFLFYFFFKDFMYMCLHVCVYMSCRCLWRLEEGIGSPEAGLKEGEIPNVGAGDRTPVFCKSS